MLPPRLFRQVCSWPLLLLAVVFPWQTSLAEPTPGEGLPFMQNFTPRDYHANTQCWSAVQDARGFMYVGNDAVVLEYDGSVWRKIPVGKTGWVRRLAYEASTDTVFIGGDKILGYLKVAPGGERVFVSLLDQLPADARDVGGVRGVYATPAGVFFVAEHRVMRWRDGHFKTWQFKGSSPLHNGWAAGSFYIQSSEIGLLRLQDDHFAPASADPFFSHAVIRGITTGPNGEVLIATFHDGLYTLQDGLVKPWAGELSAFLKDKGIYQLLLLRDGSLAIATDTVGLVILDKAGHFRRRVDDAGGLHGNNILCMYEDAEGGLWTGLQSGVTRAEINSPLSILTAGPTDDLSSTLCGGRCAGTMILGTLSGLYRVADANPATATGAHLERLPGITDAYSSAVPVENGLILASAGKIVLLDADAKLTIVRTLNSTEQHLRASRLHPGLIFVGGEDGDVSAIRLDAVTHHWINAGILIQTEKSVANYGVAESAPGDLWLGTNERGLFRSRLSADGTAAVATSLLGEPGPLQGEPAVWVSSDGGPILFQTPHKLCRLDEHEQNIRLAAEYGSRFVDGSERIESVVGYDANSIWVAASHTDDPGGEAVYGQVVASDGNHSASFHNLPRKIEEVVGHVQGFIPVDVPPQKLGTLLIIGSTGNGVVASTCPVGNRNGHPRLFPP